MPLPTALYLPFREILYILRHTLDKLLIETGLPLLRHKFMLHARRNLTLPFPLPKILSHREEFLKSIQVPRELQQIGLIAVFAQCADTSVNQRGQRASSKGLP